MSSSSPLMQSSTAINCSHNNSNMSTNTTTTTATTSTSTTTSRKQSFILNKNGTTAAVASPTIGISTFDPISGHTDYTHDNNIISSQCSPLGSPRQLPQDDFRSNIFNNVNGIFSSNDSRSNSITSLKEHLHNHHQNSIHKRASSDVEFVPPQHKPELLSPRSKFATTTPNTPQPNIFNSYPYKSYHSSPVKETNRVLLEYDPINRRKVLNTYEILREIGRGEHGKVKLAKDLINNDYVAIKIVNRKSKKERPSLRLRKESRPSHHLSDYELKIKREIAIMKKCRHKHIVSLREVLDDVNSYKIYLVLEYMEKGEIKWKRSPTDKPTEENESDIPCCGSLIQQPYFGKGKKRYSLDENDLLSNEFSPNLTFKQGRRIFRDVLLGLEYLHLQGIVHRDIKPANLLVSAENIVKISDFGVSFASSLSETEEGHLVNELDLAKTAGTPAFFAPELCRFGDITSPASSASSSVSLDQFKTPKIDYKIDIWALGVTLYCILFGRVPYNADSEYELFQVIVNNPLEFPETKESFNSPGPVTDEEFNLAKDLLSKLLDKDNTTRIDIIEIKEHPFTLMDLENDLEGLSELFTLNQTLQEENPLNFNLEEHDIVSQQEIENAVIGIGTRIKRNLVKAIRAGGWKDQEIRNKFAALQLEHSKSGSSEESSGCSNFNSQTKLSNLQNIDNHNHSMILSEGLQVTATPPPIQLQSGWTNSVSRVASHDQHPPHVPSALAHQLPVSSSSSTTSHSFSSPFSFAGIREGERVTGRSLLQEMIESHSNSSSRRGSSSGGVLSEAPQIETKRNVGGDLYLKNQSVVETFKGIQQQDDKRRRSSLFSLHSQNSSNNTKNNSISSTHEEYSRNHPYQQQQHHHHHHPNTNIAAPIPVPVANLKTNMTGSTANTSNYMNNNGGLHSEMSSRPSLKVGPITLPSVFNTKDVATIIDIDDNPESSVMSLPLSESYASLDSINDEYLSMKYEEFTNSRNLNCQSEALPVIVENGKKLRKSSFSETYLKELDQDLDIKEINQKFKTFNLGDSMKSNQDLENIDKDNTIAPRTKIRYSWSSSSTSSSSSQDDGASGSDEESDEENLTLAFSSKVTPLRPGLLSFNNRAKSHESNLPRLVHHPSRDLPAVVFHGALPEFEDVPMDLMDASVTAGSLMKPSGRLIPPSEPLNQNRSLGSSTGSQATLTAEGIQADSSVETTLIPEKSESMTKIKLLQSQLSKKNMQPRRGLRENIFHNQFNNHYKKDPIYSPFPSRSHHLDNDKKSMNKEEIRPNSYRSNSVTLELLQHQRHLFEQQQIEQSQEK
ncbi:uncharacterized protein SPAPADRAFT_64707 [Spathaspora passalidarum NRRL Y-27907]|uniref:non-specific serine/threonine protein kinase n=1 Tax=Spathaspora passalidarum (strain NRRL Y-27907 / 11-Y1) TaxID=619300 RepID=G3AE71_SPAPN|nr:uncharacterized protein SPAPADRAFT_64707 [Spathaspora passalidarum NRRL Y-27907]EGW35605.1 hypothetical protein SPAPADRAFT_64707 [Spathaspora passalidarum NRRL Y-27907]